MEFGSELASSELNILCDTSQFHLWYYMKFPYMGSFLLKFLKFFWYQEFDEIFPKKISTLVEVTLEGGKKI
jgi:hypothetical protein